MRYIAIFLVIANLSYFGWHLMFPTPPLPATTATPRPLLNQGLVLLSEFQAQAQALAAEEEAASDYCYVVGDFNTLADANEFRARLTALGFGTDLLSDVNPSTSQYQVYLAPAPSREAATLNLEQLSAQLATQAVQVDTYLITRGPLENAIALGVYAQLANAQRVQEVVSALGYVTEIAEIPQSSGPSQLVLVKPGFAPLDVAEWLDFAGDRPDLTYSENLCETIAQGVQFP